MTEFIGKLGTVLDISSTVFKPVLEVGKTYKFPDSLFKGYARTVLFINSDGVLMRHGYTNLWYNNNTNWLNNFIEVKSERWVVITYRDNLKNSVETGSKFFETEQSALDECANRPLFAGVAKLNDA